DVLSKINHSDIPVSFFESKKALGEYAGINVDAAVVALLK
ncbi:50S ribosomal protein L7ae-like protein, partial [Klebsiella pneumoniae]|nr:50S ribosomal protein L7ae-like protein [Klebsiella pneumoniae]